MAGIERAFILRIDGGVNPDCGPFFGQAEHVATGQLCDFPSLETLAEFVRRTLSSPTTRIGPASWHGGAGNGCESGEADADGSDGLHMGSTFEPGDLVRDDTKKLEAND